MTEKEIHETMYFNMENTVDAKLLKDNEAFFFKLCSSYLSMNLPTLEGFSINLTLLVVKSIRCSQLIKISGILL